MVIARVRARLKLLEAERAELEGKLGKLQRQPAIIERLVIRLSSIALRGTSASIVHSRLWLARAILGNKVEWALTD